MQLIFKNQRLATTYRQLMHIKKQLMMMIFF